MGPAQFGMFCEDELSTGNVPAASTAQGMGDGGDWGMGVIGGRGVIVPGGSLNQPRDLGAWEHLHHQLGESERHDINTQRDTTTALGTRTQPWGTCVTWSHLPGVTPAWNCGRT